MKKETKYFVEFWEPGVFVGESWKKEIKTPDPKLVKWPENAYCFNLYQREDVIDGDKVYTGERIKIGPTYYHKDSKIETLEEATSNPNSTKTLLDNMRLNEWDKIIWSRWGNWPQPFDDKKAQILL